MNKAGWDGLSKQQQAILRTSCGDGVAWSFTRSEAKQFEAMEQLQEKGVTLVRWSDEDLAKIKAAWDEVVAEEVAKDPLFKEIYDNYSSFRARYKVWGDNGYLR